MEQVERLNRFYETYDEEGRLLTRHGSVEYVTTMRYIEKYLKPGMRILEIGAATGRYSHTLARMGYAVDAVELVQHNIDIFNTLTQPGENITIRQGDARDLSDFADETYDIVLLLGPMYHLFGAENQHRALGEALRVTKKGGILFTAYCGNDACVIAYGFGRNEFRDPAFLAAIDQETFMATSDASGAFKLVRREHVEALMAHYDVTRLHFVGSDMFIHYMPATVDAWDDAFFETYLRYHFLICERPDLVGASNHFLDICRKDR